MENPAEEIVCLPGVPAVYPKQITESSYNPRSLRLGPARELFNLQPVTDNNRLAFFVRKRSIAGTGHANLDSKLHYGSGCESPVYSIALAVRFSRGLAHWWRDLHFGICGAVSLPFVRNVCHVSCPYKPTFWASTSSLLSPLFRAPACELHPQLHFAGALTFWILVLGRQHFAFRTKRNCGQPERRRFPP
jgi:hypothetical protein